MYYLSSILAFAALVAAQAADPSIATPAAVVQCQPAQISFTATKTPVFVSIIPGGQPSAAPLQDLGQQNASPFTWVASIASGTQITFQIRDSSGAVAYSAPITIQTSSDSSCLGAGASASGSASGSASSSASQVSASSSSVAGASSSSAAAVTSSVVASTSSLIASVSSAVASATAPATTSRASASSAASGSSTRSATATSAATSPSTTPNSARTNMQVGFAGLVGLAAAAVLV